MPLTKEERIALLAKARAAKAEKFKKELEEANKSDEIVPVVEESIVPEETKPSQVTTVPSSLGKTGEITLVSLDGRPLEVCIADICWMGKEITITEEQRQRFVAKGNPDFTYTDLVNEVVRILKEGGYIFQGKGMGL